MDSRSLNRIVQIKSMVSGEDETGHPVQTWTLFASVWANIRHLAGVEAIKADSAASVVRASIRVLRRSDITTGMRAYHGSDVYDIRAVLPDEQYRERMDLLCEVVNV